MGYAIMVGRCVACHTRIIFNPIRVPSLRVNGVREPLCEACANKWNQLHPDKAHPIHPEAYEACDEAELE